MKQKRVIMEISVMRLVLRVTAVEFKEFVNVTTPVGGFVELHVGSLAWRAETRLGLPVPQLECIQRLAHPAEERGIAAQVAPRATPCVGPWCLLVLQYSATEMHWP